MYFTTYTMALEYVKSNNITDYKIELANGVWEREELRGMLRLTINYNEPSYC
jgi:hypothetical protein